LKTIKKVGITKTRIVHVISQIEKDNSKCSSFQYVHTVLGYIGVYVDRKKIKKNNTYNRCYEIKKKK